MLSKRDLVPGERADELVAEWSDRLARRGARRAGRLLGGRRRDRAASASDPGGGAGGRRGRPPGRRPAPSPGSRRSTSSTGPRAIRASTWSGSRTGSFEVRGRGIELLVARHDLENPEALAYLEQRLGEIGVLAALRSAGFEPGDEVRIGELAFELLPGSAVGPHAKKSPMTVVAKLGSSIVADDDGALRSAVLDSVCGQVAELHRGRRERGARHLGGDRAGDAPDGAGPAPERDRRDAGGLGGRPGVAVPRLRGAARRPARSTPLRCC